jgi:hypothetical protein
VVAPESAGFRGACGIWQALLVATDGPDGADDLEEADHEYQEALAAVSGAVGGAGREVIEATRELLAAFPTPGGMLSASSTPTLVRLMKAPTAMTQYQSIAMLAAVVRLAASQSGQSEGQLLDGLAANY